MSVDERVVYYSDQYLSNVMMDGHLLTFCNNGMARVREMISALETIGAKRELDLMGDALAVWIKNGCPEVPDASDTLASALDAVDQRFFDAAAATDSLEAGTKRYVLAHITSFIDLE